MLVEIFDVGHGACALITADNGVRMMIDCGHRAAPYWAPGDELRRRGISTLELLYITNYDEDHVSGLSNLLDRVSVQWIFRNATVTPSTIKRLKSADGMGPGIDRLVSELTHNFTLSSAGAQIPALHAVNVSTFSNPYPSFTDENNLSMIVHLDCMGVGIMFTGDMEIAGFAPLLNDPVFVDRLKRTNVFVAPHHGRESGCCPLVASVCNPYYVVISDKEHMYATQQTHVHYSRMAKGGPFRHQNERRVLTTRNDGSITVEVTGPHTWTTG